jgi:CrcB protein
VEQLHLRHLLLVGVGGVVGALSRYGVDEIFSDIALATFIVNLFGVALAAVCTYRLTLTTDQRLFLVPGFSGGFTTYSAFAVLLYDLTLAQAGLYIIASLILSLALIRVIRAGAA